VLMFSGMPASMSANLIGEYIPHAEVKIFEKAAHGLYLTHAEKVLEEIVAFVSGLE
jgi:pimeloyl-ACP methyl ester carboxylesterase